MRIAFITHQWPGARLGGIGVYTLHCARALADAGHEAHIFTFTLPDEIRASTPAKIRVHEVPGFAERLRAGTIAGALAAGVQAAGEGSYRLSLAALLCDEVRRVHAETPFDVVEGPEYEGLMLPLIVSPLSGDVRLVTHLHSGSAIVRGAQDPADITDANGLLSEAIECATMLGADAVCAPSRQVVMDTRKQVPLGEVAILPPPFFAELRERVSAIGQNILYIGRLEMVKGAHLLPAAANYFLSRYPKAHLRLAGPDTAVSPDPKVLSMAEWIRKRLDASVAPRVHFLGEQSRAQLTEELHRAAFVVVPSLFDSYSYVCCEAMAAGRAVVVSDNIGATEVVGDAGITFERGNAAALGQAIEKLWNDACLREKLSAAALHRAKTVLSSEHTLGRRIGFYEQLCKSSPAPSLTGCRAGRLASVPPHYIASLLKAVTQLAEFVAGVPDPSTITPGMRLTNIMDKVAKETGRPTRVILFGAGRHTSRLLAESHLWESKGHGVAGIIDDHPRFQNGGTHLGLPVESRMQFEACTPSANPAVIVLSSDTFQEQFWQQTDSLRSRGVRVFKLYETGKI